MNKKDEEKLNKQLLALFVFMLKYSQSREFKNLLSTYKYHRDDLKDKVNRIYAKYNKNGELQICNINLQKELKVLEKDLKTIGTDLKKQEDALLTYILYKVYEDTYYKSNNILKRYIDTDTVLNVSELADKDIKDFINKKIDDKNVYDRNKINKEKFILKVKNDIKRDLKKDLDIGQINRTIDKNFGSAAYISERLLEHEIAINFNGALKKSYIDNNIEKVRYNSALEDNTCGICESLHDVIFNIDEAPDLPQHVKCQCWYEPVL